MYAPTPMIHEPIFSLPAVATPTVQDTMVSAPVVIPPMTTMNEYGAQYDKLFHLTVEPVDGGVKNRHSYSQ